MKQRKWKMTHVCGILLAVLIIAGCAGPNLYSINMSYDVYNADISEAIKNNVKNADAAVSVAEFTDSRTIDDSLVIGRVIERDGTNVLVLPKNIRATKAVSNGIRQYLKEAGYRVSEKTEEWNLKEDAVPRGDSRILVGGRIEELEINCRKGFLTNSYTSGIKLNIVLADRVKGTILHHTVVESRYATEDILFSEDILGEQADIVLADAIEKLFEDKNVVQKLKEAMIQQN